MGILETLTARSTVAPAGPLFNSKASAPAREERQDAKVWVNIGYYVSVGDERKLINLPLGMPLDTMKPVKITGQNPDWIKVQTARNGFLNELQKLGAELQPGQTVDLTPNADGVVVQLRRVDEKVEVAAADNEYAIDISKLIFGGAANQMAAE